MSLVEVENVRYAYADGFEALRGVTLRVEKGERVAVLGPNGAGKSTLFQMFNGLLSPAEGRVSIGGLPVEKKNLYEIRAKVGMVFQDPDDQLFNSTVRQEVAYGLMNRRLTRGELTREVDWALEAAGVAGYGAKSPHNLSGGEKKRVALASVLAMKPEVLVLDEPTAALDPHGVSSLVKLLNQISREMGITLIFSSHDTDMVPLLADRVYLLHGGKVLASGGTGEVFAQKERVRGIGLRLPRVAHLAELLERDGALPSAELPLTIGRARHLFLAAGVEGGRVLPQVPAGCMDGRAEGAGEPDAEKEAQRAKAESAAGAEPGMPEPAASEIEIAAPADIERRSFEIIGSILGGRKFPSLHEPIIKRVIHATADFEYADLLRIGGGAVEAAAAAVRGGCSIVTDTKMAAAGIHKKALEPWGGRVVCLIDDEAVAREAKERGVTRSSVCMERAAEDPQNRVFVLGNAPTALLRLAELIEEGKTSPACVVGVPVGFVNVLEAKRRMLGVSEKTGVPAIVAEGRKGGSTVAAAIVNAILYLLRDGKL